jgi:hypothetical protein
MKLTEKLRKDIDDFFQNITAEDLYRISEEKYGLEDNQNMNFENQRFDTVSKSLYQQNNSEIDVVCANTSLPQAA